MASIKKSFVAVVSSVIFSSAPAFAADGNLSPSQKLFAALENSGAQVETRMSDYFSIDVSNVNCTYAPKTLVQAECSLKDELAGGSLLDLTPDAARELYAALLLAGAQSSEDPTRSHIMLARVRCLLVDDGRHPAYYSCDLLRTLLPQVLNPSEGLIDVGNPAIGLLFPEPVQGLNPDFGL